MTALRDLAGRWDTWAAEARQAAEEMPRPEAATFLQGQAHDAEQRATELRNALTGHVVVRSSDLADVVRYVTGVDSIVAVQADVLDRLFAALKEATDGNP